MNPTRFTGSPSLEIHLRLWVVGVAAIVGLVCLFFGAGAEETEPIYVRHSDRFESSRIANQQVTSFIGHVLGIEDPKQREAGSLACVVMAVLAGAAIVRVHDVRATVEAARLCSAVLEAQ